MTERGVGKPWTPYEDNLLIQAVAIHGEDDNWKTVALSVPGRTNKACRKRWLHSLSPSVKKTAWTAEEDKLLLSLYAVHGTKWSVIARNIPGRTDDACSKRYREALDPSLKKDEWTSEEDTLLLNAYARLGSKWGQVGHELNRSGLACRNRWRMLERKKALISREGSDIPSQTQPVLNANANPSMSTSAQIAPTVWSTIPILHAGHFWDDQSSHYPSPSALLPTHSDEMQTSGSSFLAPHYAPPPEPARHTHDIMRTEPPHPPPFQFASSSLSSALSIAGMSPPSSHHEERSPVHPVELLSDDPGPNYGFNQRQVGFANTSQDSSHTSGRLDVDFGGDAFAFPGCTGEPLGIPPAAPAHEDFTSEPSISGVSSPRQGPQTTPPSPTLDSHLDDDRLRGSMPAALPCTSHYYRTPSQKVAKPVVARKRIDRTGQPPRLSSKLAAGSDPNILAYACGFERCWPSSSESSISCFATSQELSDHWKAQHPSESGGSKPFRCSLVGCGKGWKSINGLQYHLQISKAHFQQALSATFASHSADVATTSEVDSAPEKQRKTYPCPHPNCRNQYKQLSGLRYHLSHGHSQDLPAQLDIVPPVLARKVAEKMQGRMACFE